jgi:hypothetical protein
MVGVKQPWKVKMWGTSNHAISTPCLPTIIDARPNAIVEEHVRIANYAHPLDSPPNQRPLHR